MIILVIILNYYIVSTRCQESCTNVISTPSSPLSLARYGATHVAVSLVKVSDPMLTRVSSSLRHWCVLAMLSLTSHVPRMVRELARRT